MLTGKSMSPLGDIDFLARRCLQRNRELGQPVTPPASSHRASHHRPARLPAMASMSLNNIRLASRTGTDGSAA